MEKQKFALPAPNFQKIEAPKSQPLYLTPSGMTLLTRERQPPPMYGPKGSTIPPKFLQQNTVKAEREEEPSKSKPYCEACEMELQSVDDFRRHRSQHEKCPVDGCKFKGHPNVMDKHVTELHSSGIFDKIKKLSTPEEIAAWREERRRKFPTLANAKMRQLAQEQRERRGERLQENKARFGRHEDRKRARANNSKDDGGRFEPKPKRIQNNEKYDRKGKDKRANTIKTQRPTEKNIQEKNVEKLNETVGGNTDENVVCGIRMFSGTSKLEDYKHEMPKKEKVKNALSSLLGMYGSSDDEGNDSESDSATCSIDSKNPITVSVDILKTKDQIGHYSEVSDATPITNTVYHKPSQTEAGQIDQETFSAENCDNVADETKSLKDNFERDSELKEHEKNLALNTPTKEETFAPGVGTLNTVLPDKETNANESSDGEPEEAPIQRVSTLPEINLPASTEIAHSSQVETIEAKRLRIEQSRKKIQDQRTFNLNIRKRKLRKQNTMLEKLLAPEIRHERNVLLQCVRFVCENNFFGIGAETAKNEVKDETKTLT